MKSYLNNLNSLSILNGLIMLGLLFSGAYGLSRIFPSAQANDDLTSSACDYSIVHNAAVQVITRDGLIAGHVSPKGKIIMLPGHCSPVSPGPEGALI